MTEKKNSNITVSRDGGMVREVLNKLRLIFRLMGDSRVSFLAKLVPIGTLIYMISPVDAVSIPIVGAVDDAALLWLGSYIFTELCPPSVVAEHIKQLESNMDGGTDDEIVDAETTEE